MRTSAALRGPRKLVALIAAATVFALSAVIAPLVSADPAGACITAADLDLAATPSEDEAGVITLTWTPVDCGDDVTGIEYEYAIGDAPPDDGWLAATNVVQAAGRKAMTLARTGGETSTFHLRATGVVPVPDECTPPEPDGVDTGSGDAADGGAEGQIPACTDPPAITPTPFASDAPSTATATARKAQPATPTLEFVQRTERGFAFTVTNLADFGAVEKLRVSKFGHLGWTKELTVADLPYALTDTGSGETVGVAVQVLQEGFVYSGKSGKLDGQALYDAVPPTLKIIDRTDDGFIADIANLTTFWVPNPRPLPGDQQMQPPAGYADMFYSDTLVSVTKTGPGVLFCDGLSSQGSCDYGRIVVTGLTSGQSATVTVSVTDGNHVPASTSITSQAKFIDGLITPALELVPDSRSATGFTVRIANYSSFAGSGAYGDGGTEHSNSYYTDRVITATVVGERGGNPTVHCGPGAADTTSTCTGDVITVSGLKNGGLATVTVTVTSKNHPDSVSRIEARARYVPEVPQFGNVTRTADGFIVKIDNFATFGKAPYGKDTTITATVTGPNGGLTPLEGARVRCDGNLDPGPTNSIDCAFGTIVISGLPAGAKADLLVTITSDNHPEVGARVTGEALGRAVPVSLGEVVSGKGFIRVQITDIDQAAAYAVSTDAGTAFITDGWVNVTGLQPGQAANLVVTATRPTFADGQAKTTGAALRGAPTITVGTIVPREGGFSVPITDYDASATYQAMVEGGGTASFEGATGRVTGLKQGDAATLTLTVSREGHESASATAAYRMPADAGTDANPTGGAWPPQIQELAAGLGAVTRNGSPVKSATKVAKRKATVSWHGMTYTASHTVAGTIQKTRNKELYVPWGGDVMIDVKGFAPESRVQVWIFSTPTLLGTFTTGSTSRGLITVTMPPYLESGDHTLLVSGVNTAGELVTMATGMTLQAPADPGDDGGSDQTIERIPAQGATPGSSGGPGQSHASSNPGSTSDTTRVVGVQKRPGGSLANTGTRTRAELRWAATLIALGAGLMIVARRRIDDAPASAPACGSTTGWASPPPSGLARNRVR